MVSNFNQLIFAWFYSDFSHSFVCFAPLFISAFLMMGQYGARSFSQSDHLLLALFRSPRVGRLALLFFVLQFLLTPIQAVLKFSVVDNLAILQAIDDREQLVEALERYYLRTGEYPPSLEGLIPGELNTVPQLPNGQPFLYEKHENSYTLSYLKPGSTIFCQISAHSIAWHCH